MAYMGELQKAIILYLASRASRCATVEEIVSATKHVNKSRKQKLAVLKALSRLAEKKMITRSWITVEGKKKRLYCIRGVSQ